jgi:lipopolysaccharide/colanic/teichoic acid biosynthesis glycosyltransferase
MLKSQRTAYVTLMLVLDVVAMLLAFMAAWALRDSLVNFLVWIGGIIQYPVEGMVRRAKDLPKDSLYRIFFSPNPLVGFKNHLLIFYLAVPAWLFFLNTQGGYDPQTRRNARQQFALCAYSGMLGTATILILLYLIKFQVSRLLILNFMLLGIAFLCLDRTVMLPLLQRRGRQPIRNLLVIGNQAAVQYFSEILQTPAYRWSRLIGFVSDSPPSADDTTTHEAPTREALPHETLLREAHLHEATQNGNLNRVSPENSLLPAPSSLEHPLPPYLGKLNDLETILDRHVIDEVVMVRSQGEGGGAPGVWGDVLELCLQRGRTVSLVDDIVPPVGAKVEATMTGTLPTLVLHNTPQNTLGLALKNVMDRAIALIALIVLSPLLLAIAIAIKVTSPGPVLFKQKRVGLNGRLFSFYKFRSMVINAEEILEKNRAEWEKHNKMSGGFFKWEDDPRITKVGKFLRKYSLDELPQFWNVLRGDMSLVGPRPPLPKEVEQLQPWQRRKLSVKGGLTCLWQVSGRNEINTDEWMRLDLEYIDNWSLWLDIKLLLKTVKVLVKPKGAS